MNFLKRVIQKAIEPFVDRGPFGAGPAFSVGVKKAQFRQDVFDVAKASWLPPSGLLEGKSGVATAHIGTRFPVLSLDYGHYPTMVDADFCNRLLEAAKRYMQTGNIQEPVLRAFARPARHNGHEFDREVFLKNLGDVWLAEVEACFETKVWAANIVADAGVGAIDLTTQQWEAICKAPYDFTFIEPDEFISRINAAGRPKYSMGLFETKPRQF